MASFPLVSNNGFFITQEKLNLCVGNFKLLKGRRTLSCSLSKNGFSSVCKPFAALSYSYKPQHRLLCSKNGSLVFKKKKNFDAQLVRGEDTEFRKKFSLRLRRRKRLSWRRLARASMKSTLNDIQTFLRNNVKRLTLSTSVPILLGLCFLFLKITSMSAPQVVPYSDLIASLQNGCVSKVLFEEGTRRIYYNTQMLNSKDIVTVEDRSLSLDENVVDTNDNSDSLRNNLEEQNMPGTMRKSRKPSPTWQFSTRKIDHDESYLLGLMREKRTSYASAPQSTLMSMRSMLITVLTLWIPLIPLMYLLYRQLSAANSPAKKRRPSNQLVCFEDVDGVDSAKVELMEIVCCLQGSINYSKLGARLPRGVLLVGPPGTGKTLLARAVAGEARVPFFSVSASEFVELFVGRGAARIRDLFKVARKNAPSIIFIDELDAVGGKRGRSFNDERDQTLNQLLTEMDGFESDINVVVIAATNRPEALDPALCRPGRFSRKVYVGEPDEDGRKKILAIHLRGIPLDEDKHLISNLVASLTQGFVGADLANIVNEAALLAARRGAESVSREDIMEAIERAKYGINEKQRNPNTIRRELGKLFPWMPSLMGRDDTGQDGTQGPLGYQTLA
ncbi:probable inactive ATP-dependent zinc metalloprotease FTSHI 3, chloroplastic isoform X1 [Primulina huaijiensis]|uniref:probable inactive ATP-dependent zinc metalloprotease FTSHI 3, chloroplastic isoform X1 n=1 Tax=Primulina huaijiensis TaxID=1492673 RepID=UPI003CC78CC3